MPTTLLLALPPGFSDLPTALKREPEINARLRVFSRLLMQQCSKTAQINTNDAFISNIIGKGQLNSELIYEIIVSPKMPTKNWKDFFPGSLLKGRAEIFQIFGWNFGRKDDLINSF